MAAYQTYIWERKTWPQFRQVGLTEDQARAILKDLNDGFRAEMHPSRSHHDVTMAVNTRATRCSWCYPILGHIELCERGGGLNLGTLIHEFTHALTYRAFGSQARHHGRLFKLTLKRVYSYGAKYLPQPQKETVSCTPQTS